MQFVSDFRKNKLKKVRKLSRIEAIKFSISHLYINNSVAKEYPAHLHINIMPDFQRMGLGGELIDELLCHLNGKGVPRLHLGTNDANKKACNFYKKFGFHIIKEVAGSVIFGIDIPAYVSSRERKEISK